MPPAFRYAAFAVLLLPFVPALARMAYRVALAASGRHAKAPIAVGLTVAVLTSAASIVAFHHFRVATNLLGDGQLIAQSFEAAEEGHQSVIMRSAKAIVTEAMRVAASICIYTNDHIAVETL